MTRVFIDGSAGTTGLRIYERLEKREDVSILRLPEELRKDESARREMLNKADVVFLCLPDGAAAEAVAMIENAGTAVIDASTAHRTAEGWEYGFPELEGRRAAIKHSKRIANPGCHASGFIALVEPLVRRGLIDGSARLSCFSLTGYSGGGKGMISAYEAADRDALLSAPRLYGVSQTHKHLPEMVKICNLEHAPVFCPVVAPFYSGMEVIVPLFGSDIKVSVERVRQVYREYYGEGLVRYAESADEGGFMSAAALSGRDDMQISVYGNDERVLLVSRYDNLGKGASGAAIQNMNILLGVDEFAGLNI